MAHWLACAWGITVGLEADSPRNWLTAYPWLSLIGDVNAGDVTAGDMYVIALYWAWYTITTVGYGDVVRARRVLLHLVQRVDSVSVLAW
jgi:hypothetical protein